MATAALPLGPSGPAATEIDTFVDRLAELSLARWPVPATTPAGHALAAALLDAVIADQQLGVTAWYVRDLVETSAFLAGCDSRCTRVPPAGRRRRACELAALAALALLVRPLLPAADFDALYGPFALVLPRNTLTGDRARHPNGSVVP